MRWAVVIKTHSFCLWKIRNKQKITTYCQCVANGSAWKHICHAIPSHAMQCTECYERIIIIIFTDPYVYLSALNVSSGIYNKRLFCLHKHEQWANWAENHMLCCCGVSCPIGQCMARRPLTHTHSIRHRDCIPQRERLDTRLHSAQTSKCKRQHTQNELAKETKMQFTSRPPRKIPFASRVVTQSGFPTAEGECANREAGKCTNYVM